MKVFSISLFLVCAFPVQAKVFTWNCIYETRATLEGVEQENLILVFKLDTNSERAVMEGNAGLVDVEFHFGKDALSFSEKVASGAIQTTTITNEGLSVHSRNTVILDEIVAAQHFGKCSLE